LNHRYNLHIAPLFSSPIHEEVMSRPSKQTVCSPEFCSLSALRIGAEFISEGGERMSTVSIKKLFVLAALVAVLSIVAACAAPPTPAPTAAPPTAAPPAAQPTTAPAPQPTTAPAATAAPTKAPTAAAPAFAGLKFSAPDCKYTDKAKNVAGLKSIAATDASTVVFTLCHPDPDLLYKLAFAAFGIEPKAYLEKTAGDTTKVGDKPIGTGPYVISEWQHGDHITFTANPNYWGPAPKNKTVILKWSKEATQRLLELQSGTADGMDNVATEDIASVLKNASLKLYPRSPETVVYLGMNNKFPPFDNEKVRQAVAMAIDKKRIADNFYPAGTTVADQFLTPDIKPGYSDNMAPPKFDVTAAKALLVGTPCEKGCDVKLSFRTVVRQYLPSPDKVATDLQAQLKPLGINVSLNPMESGAFLDQEQAGNNPFFLLGWIDDYPAATDIFDPHFSAANKGFGATYTDIAQEISAGASVVDAAARQQHYDKVNQLLAQHVPMVPLVHGTSACVYPAKVTGAQCSPFSDEYFQYISNGTDKVVWLQGAEPLSAWCADEEDGETFRLCIQVYDALYNYEQNGVKAVPGLATSYDASPDATVWTFHLRQGVKFSDGSAFDANDVVANFNAWWDAKNPAHKGRTGDWTYFGSFLGAQLNAQ
jgi:peptide/nickel transport system substrate-binding protein